MLYTVTFPDGTTRTLQADSKRALEEMLAPKISSTGLKFEPQNFSLTTCDGETRLVTCIEGIGTGLGYYQTAEGNFVLVHLQSGVKLGNNEVQTQGQAQKWLELVSLITDWNRSVQEIRNDPDHIYTLRVEIAQAWAKVTGQIP